MSGPVIGHIRIPVKAPFRTSRNAVGYIGYETDRQKTYCGAPVTAYDSIPREVLTKKFARSPFQVCPECLRLVRKTNPDLSGLQPHVLEWQQENRAVIRERSRIGQVLREILSNGGHAVCRLGEISKYEERRYAEDGRAWPTKGRKFVPMRKNNCHGNVAILWGSAPMEEDPDIDIVTGFALSDRDEGLWRSHTWAWDRSGWGRSGRIIETTVRFLDYWGYRLTADEAESFYEHNA